MDKVVLVAVVMPQRAATLAVFVALGGSLYLALTIADKDVEHSSLTGAEAEARS